MKNDKSNSKNSRSGISPIWLLIIGGLIIFILPVLFVTLNLFGISFTESGQIGDTIGGITAPFIGLGGAILVYISFREQVKANREIQKQINVSQMERNFEFIVSEINRLIDSRNEVIEKEFENEKRRIREYIKTLKEAQRNPYLLKNDSDFGKSQYEHHSQLLNKSIKELNKIILVMDEMKRIGLTNEQRVIVYRKFQYEIQFINTNMIMDLVKELQGVNLGYLLNNFDTLIKPIHEQIEQTQGTLLIIHAYLEDIHLTLQTGTVTSH